MFGKATKKAVEELTETVITQVGLDLITERALDASINRGVSDALEELFLSEDERRTPSWELTRAPVIYNRLVEQISSEVKKQVTYTKENNP